MRRRNIGEPGNVEPGDVIHPTTHGPLFVPHEGGNRAVTGTEVTEAERAISKMTLKPDGCLYRADRPYGAIVVGVEASGPEDFQAWIADESRPEAHNVVEQVTGLGDEAYLIGRGGLSVRQGSVVLQVETQYIALDGPAVLHELVSIALERL